jgi:hypothetical protein
LRLGIRKRPNLLFASASIAIFLLLRFGALTCVGTLLAVDDGVEVALENFARQTTILLQRSSDLTLIKKGKRKDNKKEMKTMGCSAII